MITSKEFKRAQVLMKKIQQLEGLLDNFRVSPDGSKSVIGLIGQGGGVGNYFLNELSACEFAVQCPQLIDAWTKQAHDTLRMNIEDAKLELSTIINQDD